MAPLKRSVAEEFMPALLTGTPEDDWFSFMRIVPSNDGGRGLFRRGRR